MLQKQPKIFVEQKGEDAIDHSTVIGWFKKFHSTNKNLDNQVRSDKLITMNFASVLQAIGANLLRSTQRVSSELSISQSSVVRHLHNFSKRIWSCEIVPHIIKTFDSTSYNESTAIFYMYTSCKGLSEIQRHIKNFPNIMPKKWNMQQAICNKGFFECLSQQILLMLKY